MKIRILSFGNLPNKNENSIGGATILYSYILQGLRESDSLEVRHVPLRKKGHKWILPFEFLKVLLIAPFKIIKSDVVCIHATQEFHRTIAPIVVLFCRFFRKKIIYHFFGGSFFWRYESFTIVFKWILRRTIFKSNVILIETLQMKSYFENQGVENILWFPNFRPQPNKTRPPRKYNKKFVFVSRLSHSKGIDIIKEAFRELDENYSVDLYGPLIDYTIEDFDNNRFNYKGLLSPESVQDTLINYDVLILPTFHEGEGYPGIIIEALSVGLPVITTDWNALNELIQDDYNGFLIKPKSKKSLIKAILGITDKKYNMLTKNVEKSNSLFSAGTNIEKLVNSILKLTNKHS